MSWLRKSKKFSIGLIIIILFLFLLPKNRVLAQGELFINSSPYLYNNNNYQPNQELIDARANYLAAKIWNFFDIFNINSALHTYATMIPILRNFVSSEYMSDAQRKLIEAEFAYQTQVSLNAAKERNVSEEELKRIKEEQDKTNQQLKEQLKSDQERINKNPSSPSDILSDIIARMFAWLLYYIAVGLGWILMLISFVMLKIAVYNNFLREDAIHLGWQIIRDICNNFFIILLIITAISTMLRQGDFKDWRSMLPKILVAAVIINFSLLMCGIFIDVSQIFTLTFASPLNSITGYNVILAAMGIPSSMQLSNLSSQIDNGIENIDLIAALIYATIITFVTIVVVTAITVLLAYRIIMLWFLVILSPLPILLSLLKRGASYVNLWWEEFFKYLIVGPAVMFFLYLSFMFMGKMNNTGTAGNTSNVLNINTQSLPTGATIGSGSNVTLTSGKDTVSLSNAASPNGVINFLIVISLMAGSLLMAQKIGTKGSKFAGQSLTWLQNQGKRWSGFNLAKNLAKSAPRAVGTVGTAVDDKLGLRQKLYGTAFVAGGKYIPFAGQALGRKIGALEEGTQKRINAKYSDLAKDYKVDKMDEEQLRKLASKGGSAGVVATQALMKKGLFRDGDELNRANNIDIIKKAREALKGTDLGNTFDENLKKYNPSLAFSTIYDGKLDKLRSDLKLGKIDIDKLMAGMTPEQINKLKADLGGGNGAVAKFILSNSSDIGKTLKGMNKQSRELVTQEIDHKTFAKRINPDGTIAEYDDETRRKYLSSKPADIMKIFDMNDKTELEKARKQFSKNRETILREMDPEGMTSEFIKNFGDLFNFKELEKNFSDRSFEHKTAATRALQEHLDASLKEVNFEQLAQNLARAIASGDKVAIEKAKKEQADMDELVKKNLLAQGNLSPSVIKASGSDDALERILGNLNGDDASKINWGNLSDQEKNIISQHINPNALKLLATRGDNNELIRGVRDNIRTRAKIDNDNEQIFNNAKQRYNEARGNLESLRKEITDLSNEADDAKKAGDSMTYQKLQSKINRLKSQEATLQANLSKAENEYNQALNNYASNLDDNKNWKETDLQKREKEIIGKKSKNNNKED